MKTINKNHIFSKLKLGARRSPECRIFHHLPQSFSGLQTPGCKGTSLHEVHGLLATQFQLFSSPDPKGQVRYCHHFASVVRLLTFSYFNLLL